MWQDTLLYKILIYIYGAMTSNMEVISNFLNNIGLIRRRKAQLPDNLNDKIVVITGANSGIGKFTAKTCSSLGAHVIMCCRDLERSQKILDELKEELKNENKPSNLTLMQLDLSSMKSVRKCCENINNKVDRIDFLINNAGIMMCPETITEDGYESQFQTNHLGHFLLTNLLIDKIKASPKARIINLTSVAHLFGTIHFDNINLKNEYKPLKSYAQSKLSNVLFTLELARRLKKFAPNVTTYAVHPGIINTNLARHLVGYQECAVNLIRNKFFLNPELGAQTTLYCCFQKDLEEYSGRYFRNCCKNSWMLPHATNLDVAKKLWLLSSQICNIDFNLIKDYDLNLNYEQSQINDKKQVSSNVDNNVNHNNQDSVEKYEEDSKSK